MLIVGFLAFSSSVYNIIYEHLPYQWFGLVSGALLIWIFFNINKLIKENHGKSQDPNAVS